MAAEEEEEHLKLLPYDSRHLISLFRALLRFTAGPARTRALPACRANPGESQKGSSSALAEMAHRCLFTTAAHNGEPRASVCGVLWTNRIDDLLFILLVGYAALPIRPPPRAQDFLCPRAFLLSTCARASRPHSAYFGIYVKSSLLSVAPRLLPRGAPKEEEDTEAECDGAPGEFLAARPEEHRGRTRQDVDVAVQ